MSLLGVDSGETGLHSAGRLRLHAAGRPVPTFTYPETAARALAHAVTYGEWRRRPAGTVPVLDGTDANEVRRRLHADGARGWVTGAAAMDVLAAYRIPTLPTVEVDSAEAAVAAAEEFAAAVALKAIGPKILHKSDIGGVKLRLGTPAAVGDAYKAMAAALGESMTGAVVQPMAPPGGVEVIVGAVRDPGFGPQILFGLGGVTAEILHDTTVRLAPLTDVDAREMIEGLRGSALLHGFRGTEPVDIDGLTRLLHRVSRLAEDLPELAELDCNPVVVSPQGVAVVDARLRVSSAVSVPDDTRHLR